MARSSHLRCRGASSQQSVWAIAPLRRTADNRDRSFFDLPAQSAPWSPVASRRFDPALLLAVLVAAALVVASTAVHRELVAHDQLRRRDSAAAMAELVAARVEANLRDVLSTLETAAGAPSGPLDQRTETLRARGVMAAAARVDADGRRPTFLVGDPAALGSATTPALDAARDSGQARLERPPDGRGFTALAPTYRGVPRGTLERRKMLDGFVVASVDVTRLVSDILPADIAAEVRLTDDAAVVATVGETRSGPRGRHVVEAGGAAYVLTLAVPPPPSRPP